MILKQWIKSNHGRMLNGSTIDKSDQLHVLGTCGNCMYWDQPPDKYGDHHFETIWCEKYEEDQTCTEWRSDCE